MAVSLRVVVVDVVVEGGDSGGSLAGTLLFDKLSALALLGDRLVSWFSEASGDSLRLFELSGFSSVSC